jgi:hypothetical protein
MTWREDDWLMTGPETRWKTVSADLGVELGVCRGGRFNAPESYKRKMSEVED